MCSSEKMAYTCITLKNTYYDWTHRQIKRSIQDRVMQGLGTGSNAGRNFEKDDLTDIWNTLKLFAENLQLVFMGQEHRIHSSPVSSTNVW